MSIDHVSQVKESVSQSHGAQPRVSEGAVIARTFSLVLSGLIACWWTADPDLWGHLRFGLDAIRDRGLTSIDPYSFTSDQPWINHEWLSETAMGAAYLLGGIRGLLALKIVLVGGTFALLARHLRDASAPAKWWVLGVAAILSAPIATTMRPQLWTVLLLTVVSTTTHWSTTRQAMLWPLIFVFWANLHGGWIVGLGVIGVWTVGRILDTRDWGETRQLLCICLLCLAATLVTPYGLTLWTFIADTVALDRSDVSEWHPVWVEGATIWLGTLLFVMLLARRAFWSWAAMLPVLMLAIGSAKVGRLGGLWVICAVAFLLPRWSKAHALAPFPRGLVAVLIVLALIPSAFIAINQTRCLPIYGWRAPDFDAAGALSAVSGRLMVPFEWGEFAIWQFGPRLKVSFDGRRETVYSRQRIEEQHGLASGDLSIAPFIREQEPEYVWVPRPQGDKLAAHLASAGYRADITTAKSVILTRADLPALTAAPISGCLQ
jgi:hypothetical protein